MITHVDVRMHMRRAVVSVRVGVDEEFVRLRATPRAFESLLSGPGWRRPDAEQNQHDCHREFHRQSEPGRDRNFENNDRGADYQHGECVPESPYDADTGGDGQAMFAAEDSSDGDHVIGIGRVTHSEQQSQERNRERRGIGRNHQVCSFSDSGQNRQYTYFFSG